MDIFAYLNLMSEKNASDLFFSVGAPPNIKIGGKTHPIDAAPLTPADMQDIIKAVLNEDQQKEFATTFELNMAMSLNNGRCRFNLFRQRGEVAIVVRFIVGKIPTIEDLHLPQVLKSIVMEARGLVLVVGATSSGKSTTLASMIDFRNSNHHGHILTIEDPIEYLHHHKQSIIDQREVGIDTLSYDNALKNAMREAPDVILIGEIRDRNTMKQAISYAETGHLCLSTLHANSANHAMERVSNFFTEEAKTQLLFDLSVNLRAVISLRLVPGIQQPLVPAVEVMLNTAYIANLIEKGKIEEIKEVMERAAEQGMQTFDKALFALYKEGKITKDNAIRYADSKNNVELEIRLSEEGRVDKPSDLTFDRGD